jgi:hypothetical protein
MTDEEIIKLQEEIDTVKTAISRMSAGERVTEVRFGDRIIKYAEISLPELQAELSRLQGMLPAPISRLRPLRYQGL